MDTQTLGIYYVSVVQGILLFGSETWVVTPRIKRVGVEGPPQGSMEDLREDALQSD